MNILAGLVLVAPVAAAQMRTVPVRTAAPLQAAPATLALQSPAAATGLIGTSAPIVLRPSLAPALPSLAPLSRAAAAPAAAQPLAAAVRAPAPAAAVPSAFAALRTGALRAVAASRRPGDLSDAAASFAAAFDGTDVSAGDDGSLRSAPTVADEALFVFGVQGSLLGAVQRALKASGYDDPARIPAERAALLDAAFDGALAERLPREGTDHIPSPAAYAAAIDAFAQLRRVAKESAAAYPGLRFEDNYILKSAFHALSDLGDRVGSMEEYRAAVRTVADHALDLPIAEAAYFEHALPTMYDLFLRRADAARETDIRTPEELARRYEDGLAELEAGGRALAPSDAAFQAALALARGLDGIVRTLADAAGADLPLATQGLSSPAVVEWARRVSDARSLEEARALEAEAPGVGRTAAAGLGRMWSLNAFTRTMDGANRLIAQRRLDTAKITPAGYAELMRDAAADVQEADAPDASAYGVGRALADGFVRLFEGIAAAPGVTTRTMRSALNSAAVREWMAAAQDVSDLAGAKAHAVSVESVIASLAAAMPLYWAQDMPARLESAFATLVAERGVDVDSVPLRDLGWLAREAAARLLGDIAAEAPSDEAFTAAFTVLDQHARVVAAVSAVAADREELTRKVAILMQHAFLPALGGAASLGELASAATAAADKIVASLGSAP